MQIIKTYPMKGTNTPSGSGDDRKSLNKLLFSSLYDPVFYYQASISHSGRSECYLNLDGAKLSVSSLMYIVY